MKNVNSKFPNLKNDIEQIYKNINKKKYNDFKITQDNKKEEEINEKINSVKKEVKNINSKIDVLINNTDIFI